MNSNNRIAATLYTLHKGDDDDNNNNNNSLVVLPLYNNNHHHHHLGTTNECKLYPTKFTFFLLYASAF